MHQKRTKKIVPFEYMKNGSHPQKEQLFCSFLNVTFLEKNVICTFCLAKCIRKGQTKLFLLTTWRMALTTKRTIFLFFSERHLSRKKNVICTFCLAKCIRKGTKKLFLLTTWRMALSTKKKFFGSFLNVIFLEKKRHLYFCLAKCIRKGKKKNPFDYMKNGSLHKKSKFFVPFLTSFYVLLPLPNASEKDNKNCSFWIHEEWLSPQKEQLFCSFLNVTFLEKNVICTFCLAKCIRKGPTKLFLLTTWRMALTTKRTIFFVLFWTSSF